MYIAFKWLVTLALIMWLAMCLVESFLKQNTKIIDTGKDHNIFSLIYLYIIKK